MRVAFFGAFDPDYPRTKVLREALHSHRVETPMIAARPGAGVGRREISLLLAWARSAGRPDAILVPSFGHRDVVLASLLGRGAGIPVVFDPLVSRWDTQVADLGRVRAGGLAAARLRASDRLSMALADHVLCDTWEHGDYFANTYRIPKRKLSRVPVGADQAAFDAGAARRERPPGGPVEVVYVGGFLPLHGVETVVLAAEALERRHGARGIRFTLIGGGMTAPRVEREIASRGLRSVRRVPRVPYGEALRAIAAADVALGIFGTTPKASRVVPHKVYQALAAGVPVVTRRSRAMDELFREGGEFTGVAAGDPASLAAAIERLAADPGARERIGSAGRAAALERGSPERIGALLLEAVARARDETRPRVRR